MRIDRYTGLPWGLPVALAMILAFWVMGEGGAGRIAWYQLLGAVVLPLLALRYAPPADRKARTVHFVSVLFVAFAALSLITSLNKGVSTVHLVTLVSAVALMHAAGLVSGRAARLLVAAQVILVLPIALSAVMEPLGAGWLASHDYYPGRAMANMGGPGPLGALLAAVLPVAAAYFLHVSRRWLVLLSGIALALIIAAVTATFSRAALIAGVAGLSVVTLLFMGIARRRGGPARRRVLRRAATIAVLFALTVPAYNLVVRKFAPPEYAAGERPGTQTFQVVRAIEGTDLSNVDVRRLCWATAARVIAEHPLTGVGAGCFGMASGRLSPDALKRVAASKGFVYQFAYNDYLQFGAELGAPAAAVFLALIAAVVLLVRSHRRPADAEAGSGSQNAVAICGLTAGLCALTVQALVDFPLHLTSHAALFWLDVGLVVSLTTEARPDKATCAVRAGTARRILTVFAVIASVGMATVAARGLLADRNARESVRLSESGNTTAAVERAARATLLAPHEHTYWVLLGEAELAATDRGDGAAVTASLEAYRRAARSYPHHAPTHGRLGALLMAHAGTVPGSADSAAVHLRRAISLNSYYADPHTNLGTLLMMSGDLDGARREFLKAAELDDSAAAPLYNLGNLESEAGRRTEAMARYRAALGREPDHFGSLVNLSVHLISDGGLKEARELLERALELDPTSEQVRALLALAREPGQ